MQKPMLVGGRVHPWQTTLLQHPPNSLVKTTLSIDPFQLRNRQFVNLSVSWWEGLSLFRSSEKIRAVQFSPPEVEAFWVRGSRNRFALRMPGAKKLRIMPAALQVRRVGGVPSK